MVCQRKRECWFSTWKARSMLVSSNWKPSAWLVKVNVLHKWLHCVVFLQLWQFGIVLLWRSLSMIKVLRANPSGEQRFKNKVNKLFLVVSRIVLKISKDRIKSLLFTFILCKALISPFLNLFFLYIVFFTHQASSWNFIIEPQNQQKGKENSKPLELKEEHQIIRDKGPELKKNKP